jgi:hypothetical protein
MGALNFEKLSFSPFYYYLSEKKFSAYVKVYETFMHVMLNVNLFYFDINKLKSWIN